MHGVEHFFTVEKSDKYSLNYVIKVIIKSDKTCLWNVFLIYDETGSLSPGFLPKMCM